MLLLHELVLFWYWFVDKYVFGRVFNVSIRVFCCCWEKVNGEEEKLDQLGYFVTSAQPEHGLNVILSVCRGSSLHPRVFLCKNLKEKNISLGAAWMKYTSHHEHRSADCTGCISKNLMPNKNVCQTKLTVGKWSSLLILQQQLSHDKTKSRMETF